MSAARKLLSATVALSTALALSAAPASATTTTANDIQTLAAAESAVVSLLHSYQPTAAWNARFKTAQAKQAAALAKVDGDLMPAKGAAVLLSLTGEGTASTQKFTVPASAPQWLLNWSFNCASEGGAGNFIVSINGGSGSDNGLDQLAVTGHGTEHYYDHGTFYLEVLAGCNWSLQVTV